VGGGHKEMFHEIVGFGSHGGLAFPTPVLTGIKGNGITLDVSAAGHRDHHVFFGNKIFNGNFNSALHDTRAAPIPKLIIEFCQFILDQSPDHGF